MLVPCGCSRAKYFTGQVTARGCDTFAVCRICHALRRNLLLRTCHPAENCARCPPRALEGMQLTSFSETAKGCGELGSGGCCTVGYRGVEPSKGSGRTLSTGRNSWSCAPESRGGGSGRLGCCTFWPPAPAAFGCP